MEASLPLPSKGKVYEVPLDKIVVRTLKGGDEKLLSELSMDNVEKKYLALLQNKVGGGSPVVSGIDVGKLTLGDRLFILLWERINSYSPVFNAECLCENCFEKIQINIDLTSLSVKELPDSFVEPFPLTLANGDVVQLRLFRLDDEIKIVEREKKSGVEATYLYRLAVSMVDDKTIPDRITYLENLDSRDVARIRAFHEETVHGPDLDKVNYECPKCKEVGTIALPFRPDFLIPRGTEVI